MKPLYERVRPSCWDEVLGQEKAIAKLKLIERTSGLAGKCYFITGKSGTGKTTIARIIAKLAGSPFSTFEYADPSELNAATVETIKRRKHMRPIGNGYVYILNEAHLARNDLIGKLLGMTETGCDWITWCFTTTFEGEKDLFEDCKDKRPFMSRMVEIQLASRGVNPIIAQRTREVAIAQGLDGKPLEDYLELVNQARGNWREVYNKIEAGGMMP